jgi:hypothetical protein
VVSGNSACEELSLKDADVCLTFSCINAIINRPPNSLQTTHLECPIADVSFRAIRRTPNLAELELTEGIVLTLKFADSMMRDILHQMVKSFKEMVSNDDQTIWKRIRQSHKST